MAESSSRKFQSPKGTRDFYPADLAARRHIEDVWRQTSINHGFDEIDGPTFEHLDLYTHKSGPAIASELFQVFSGKDPEQVAAIRKGENAPLALRPEFTPTLARMVAAKAAELPRPIKWFAIPSHFRAESPQRGRLREFMQWNVDFIGDASPQADAEVIATAIMALERLGLSPTDVAVRINDRGMVQAFLQILGVRLDRMDEALQLLDRAQKISDAEYFRQTAAIGMSEIAAAHMKVGLKLPNEVLEMGEPSYAAITKVVHDLMMSQSADTGSSAIADTVEHSFLPSFKRLVAIEQHLRELGLADWLTLDTYTVRGLAYYTGTVFEIIAEGERAIAGGGRYDKLIESFGGPPLPACGFGMGDVVLANILKDKGLLKPAEEYLPRPDAFVIAANDEAAAKVPSIVADLRNRGGLHIRQSYKTTRNVGKLLGDAGKCRARYAVILGKELADTPPSVALKDMDAGSQDMIALTGDDPYAVLIERLRG